MASRKEPTPPLASSGDNPSARVMFDSAMALSQAATELERIGNQLGGLDHLERIGDALDNHAELSRIRAALEALVLLTAAAGPAPNLRDAAVKAATRIASLHP